MGACSSRKSVLSVMEQSWSGSTESSKNPLYERGVLENVLEFVGPGEWWFVSPVCSLWRDVYAQLQPAQMFKVALDLEDRVFTCIPQITLYSAIFGSASRVQLAHEAGVNCTTEVYQYAAGKSRDCAALAATHELGMPYTATTSTSAARYNQLPILQYLAERCIWNEASAVRGAASSGNIKMMAWLVQQPGVVLDAIVVRSAAAHGRTAMCKYLRSRQCPWDSGSCYAAAQGGHAETLRWLVDTGCAWHAMYMPVAAAQGGSIEVMQYLQQQGIVYTADLLTEMLNIAGVYNKLAAAQWLREQGAEWPAKLKYVGTVWPAEMIAWAKAQGCNASAPELRIELEVE
jgi:hypothetical protein